jgi:hypothetical protein
MEVALRRREQEVWQACDDLWALHGDIKYLTGDAIRERLLTLGKSKGSPNEIYKYRKSWVLSRKIDSNSSNHEPFEDNDPISRAVKMVHEKLLGEADEKVAVLQSNFEIQLFEKQQELEKKHAELGQVIIELGNATNENAKNHQALKEIEQLLVAETQVRKALERELAHAKLSHQQILEELKTAHKNTCEHVAQAYQHQEKEKQLIIERLEAEKKQLGFEFSEKLTEIKIHNYSQVQIIKNLEANYGTQANLLEEKNQLIISQESKLKIMLEEYSHMTLANQTLKAQFDQLILNQAQNQREHRQVLIKNKKNEITIARLRAMQASKGENYGAGVSVKKRTTQGIALSSSTSLKNPGASLQNPCPQ